MAYYGVRYKNNVMTESVGTTYFSSSKYVAEYIQQHGYPDIVQIRRTFATKIEAKRWEEKVIRRMGCVKSSMWLNKGNNNAFREIVMCDEIAQSISVAKRAKNKTRPKTRWYNDGHVNKTFREGDIVPVGWVSGRLVSDKQRQWLIELNASLTREKRAEMGKKVSEKTKGKSKPEGFGLKVSAAQTGKKKPWNEGDNNPAKTPEARQKISAKKKGCKHYTDGVTLVFVKPEQAPKGFWETSIYQFKKLHETQ